MQNWCQKTDFHDRVGLGDIGTSAKLLMFLELVEKRGNQKVDVNIDANGDEVPAKVRNACGRLVRNKAIITFKSDPELVASRSKNTEKLDQATVLQWVKSIVDLYQDQVRKGLNTHPHPRTQAINDHLRCVSPRITVLIATVSNFPWARRSRQRRRSVSGKSTGIV